MALSTSQRARLGAFVLVGVAATLAGMLLLAGLRLGPPSTHYRARFFDSVSGLEVGATVKYQGLKVGRVASLTIAPDEPRAIEVVLALEPNVVLHQGSQAMLDIAGLTGLKTINLTPGDIRQPRLEANTLLPTGPSLFDQISDNVAVIIADVKQVTDRISQWFTDHNRDRLESLLKNLDSLVSHVDSVLVDSRVPMHEVLGAFRDTTVSMGEAAQEASLTLASARHDIGGIGHALGSALAAAERPLRGLPPSALADTLAAMRGAAGSLQGRLQAKETGAAISSLSETLRDINQLVVDVDLVVRSGREDLSAGLSNVRQAAEDLREFSRILAQNPSALVRGRGDEE